ncbi:MAG: Na(+)-translocating NADH-quinone reductase subunit A [Gammaproteobacteria bacterium]
MLLKIRRGLDLPISGSPQQLIGTAISSQRVALLGADYPGLKPELKVNSGTSVKQGETLFTDRQTGVNYTAPAGGIVSEINRGPRRSLHSLVIQVDGERYLEFPKHSQSDLATLPAAKIKEILLASGMWPAFRTRPFNRNPALTARPHSIFVTAIDTEPLAVDPSVVIAEYAADFADGIQLISRLFDVNLYVCRRAGANIPVPASKLIKDVEIVGPHPAGLVGTHIHHIDPVGSAKSVWHVNYQDVIAIGRLFKYGRLWSTRIVSIAGPPVLRPRLVPVTMGCDVVEIVADELPTGALRMISGSVLSGRRVDPQDRFLGRYHAQISVIDEVTQGMPEAQPRNSRRYSFHSLLARLSARQKQTRFDTAMNGHRRPLITLGNFEQVMPLDIMATPLMKSLLIEDVESAGELGCLELAEEDLALCEFVCCSKRNYGAALRRCLSQLEANQD